MQEIVAARSQHEQSSLLLPDPPIARYQFEVNGRFNSLACTEEAAAALIPIWRKAASRIYDWTHSRSPEMILIPGSSGREILSRTFQLTSQRPQIAGRPLVFTNAQESHALYGHSLSSNDEQFRQKHLRELAQFLTSLRGGRLPQTLLILDDIVVSGLKAFWTYQNARSIGIEQVYFGALVGSHTSRIAFPLGSAHPGFYTFIANLHLAVSYFNRPAQIELHKKYFPTESQPLDQLRSDINQIYRLLNQ